MLLYILVQFIYLQTCALHCLYALKKAQFCVHLLHLLTKTKFCATACTVFYWDFLSETSWLSNKLFLWILNQKHSLDRLIEKYRTFALTMQPSSYTFAQKLFSLLSTPDSFCTINKIFHNTKLRCLVNQQKRAAFRNLIAYIFLNCALFK